MRLSRLFASHGDRSLADPVNIPRAQFPAVDFHPYGRSLSTAEDHKEDRVDGRTGIGVICHMDGGYGRAFEKNGWWH
jgi:hypothetical protein